MRQLIILLVLTSLASCRTEEKVENSEDVSKRKELIIQMLTDRFIKFQNAEDPLEQAKFYVENISEDAVWMPQNGMLVKGRANVQKWAEWIFSNYTLVVDPEKEFFDEPMIGGDLAVRRFRGSGYYIAKATGDSIRLRGREMENCFPYVEQQ